MLRYLCTIGLLAGVYFGAGKLGLLLALSHPTSSPAWPPAGIALAAVLLFGYRLWPGVFMGAFLVSLSVEGKIPVALAIATGNTLECLAGAWLTRRFAGGRDAFEQPADIAKFAVWAGMVSTAISASIGVLSVSAGDPAPLATPTRTWIVWWFGDMLSVLILTPVLILSANKSRVRWTRQRFLEYFLLLGFLLLASEAVFGQVSPPEAQRHVPPYLCLPFLVWAAFRFGPRETAIAILVLGANGLWGTLKGHGLFTESMPEGGLMAHQGFVAFHSLMGLVLAALVAQRQRAGEALARAHEELERRVQERTTALQKEIHEREAAELALRRAKDYAENLIQTANVMIIGLDSAGNVQVFNEAAERLTGYGRGEMVGRNWFEVLVPRHWYPAVWEVFSRLQQGTGQVPNTFENPILTKMGEERWISWRNSELREGERTIGTISFGIDVTEQRRAERALHEAHDELEKRVEERTAELSSANRALQSEVVQRQQAEEARLLLLRRLANAQETERRRVSRELHDQLGQELTALKLGLQMVRKQGPFPPPVQECVGQMDRLTDGLMRDVHRLAWELRPATLDDFGLGLTLQRYTSEWAEHCGIPVDFHSDGLEGRRLPPDVETTLYRITQETLSNVARHAQAKRVSVLIERRPDHVSLIVEDDGRGFDVEAILKEPGAHDKLGLLGMQERAILSNGTIDIESAPGAGTTVIVRLALEKQTQKTNGP